MVTCFLALLSLYQALTERTAVIHWQFTNIVTLYCLISRSQIQIHLVLFLEILPFQVLVTVTVCVHSIHYWNYDPNFGVPFLVWLVIMLRSDFCPILTLFSDFWEIFGHFLTGSVSIHFAFTFCYLLPLNHTCYFHCYTAAGCFMNQNYTRFATVL